MATLWDTLNSTLVCKNTTINRLVIIKLVIVFAVVFLGHIYSDYNQIISYKSRRVSDV